jgi:hypothetical protein
LKPIRLIRKHKKMGRKGGEGKEEELKTKGKTTRMKIK